MIREDKFGRRIFSDSVWKELLSEGKSLMELGYTESKRKPNLFYRKIEFGIFFADLRGTEIVPIWDDMRPLFYWKFAENLPLWKSRRLVKQELLRLGKSGCQCRLSFEVYNDPIFENAGALIVEDELVYCWNDGYCRICGKDFQDEGEFCSEECGKKSLELRKTTCEVCGEKIDLFKEVKHHIQYFPEKTIWVHASCHNIIHKTDKYPHLKPKDKPVKKQT